MKLKICLLIFLSLILFTNCVSYHVSVDPYTNPHTYCLWSYKKVIKKIKTPEQTAHYLENHLFYWSNGVDTYCSFKYIHERGYGICAEYAFAAAALLKDDGYPSLILEVFFENRQTTHTIFIYNKKGKWGTLGMEGENSQGAIFNNRLEVCYYIQNQHSGSIVAYIVHNLKNVNIIDDPRKNIYNEWGNGEKVMIKKRNKNLLIKIRTYL